MTACGCKADVRKEITGSVAIEIKTLLRAFYLHTGSAHGLLEVDNEAVQS